MNIGTKSMSIMNYDMNKTISFTWKSLNTISVTVRTLLNSLLDKYLLLLRMLWCPPLLSVAILII
jgi:hypothetical protein